MRTELRLPALTELLVQRCEGCWVEVLLEAAAAAFPAVRKLWVQQLSTGRLSAQQKQEHAEHMRQQGQQARQAQQAGRQQVAEAAAAVAGKASHRQPPMLQDASWCWICCFKTLWQPSPHPGTTHCPCLHMHAACLTQLPHPPAC